MRRSVWVGAALSAALAALGARAAEPIPVLILDGESGGPYHDWPRVTAGLERILGEAGLFEVDVATAPPAGGDFAAFAPSFSAYQAVVVNYDAPDERWPAALKSSLERYVEGGGGLVAVHAADNAFPGWTEYEALLERATIAWLLRSMPGIGPVRCEEILRLTRLSPLTRIGELSYEKRDELARLTKQARELVVDSL